MTPLANPFARGYQNLHIVRTLLITCEDDDPPVWRPLHASQSHLPDEDVARFPCLVGQDFALITEGQELPPELEALCQAEGIVQVVVYAIAGEDFDGRPVLVSDTYSLEAAREVVQRLRFETGFYSRCWEISSAHLDVASQQFLNELADLASPTTFLFIAFRIPFSRAIGVKLLSTPWSDQNLQAMEGISASRLRQAYARKGVPECLMEVLFLAAAADVRMLVFDDDACVLAGLPLHDG